jgi:hypothetical protein
MTPRTRRCEEATMSGRLRKAEQFLEAAGTIREFADDEHEVGDALVTLCVHGGIGRRRALLCRARRARHGRGPQRGARPAYPRVSDPAALTSNSPSGSLRPDWKCCNRRPSVVISSVVGGPRGRPARVEKESVEMRWRRLPETQTGAREYAESREGALDDVPLFLPAGDGSCSSGTRWLFDDGGCGRRSDSVPPRRGCAAR